MSEMILQELGVLGVEDGKRFKPDASKLNVM